MRSQLPRFEHEPKNVDLLLDLNLDYFMAATRLHVVGKFWQICSEKHYNASSILCMYKS